MKVTITIDTGNAAFEDCEGSETARIIRGVANVIDGMAFPQETDFVLRDANGNKVGLFEVSED